MEIAVLVCGGVFDSGLASILDVLDTANALLRRRTGKTTAALRRV